MDRHGLFVECLGIVLRTRHYDYREVPLAPATSRDEVSGQLLDLRPDLALVNADLGPSCSGVAVVEDVSRAGIPVVAVFETEDEPRWGHFLASGARMVVPKTASLSTMVSVVRNMTEGRCVLDQEERDRLIRLSARQAAELVEAQRRLTRLTRHEAEVLRHMMRGRTVREIATTRLVTEDTVRTQVKSILSKLEVHSQVSAVAMAWSVGWKAMR
ncbi:helix-turn-helix transcriptional regulator [Nocardioides mangrovi]|uniref:Response regulator transcription factor n=1 Tax=Nocardioides mangrovi TaxID=2874580 RepID=A0ABS7UDH6_9ACTN|nr:response regulator transcription factor [Nocardioides mangrovi]MBZ5738875.1 response regulator transcription factor [Nocardioides mangrovi]